MYIKYETHILKLGVLEGRGDSEAMCPQHQKKRPELRLPLS